MWGYLHLPLQKLLVRLVPVESRVEDQFETIGLEIGVGEVLSVLVWRHRKEGVDGKAHHVVDQLGEEANQNRRA